MTEEDYGHFINSTKCWICDNTYVKDGVKVRDHCHITGKYRGSAHKDCNIKVNLNHKGLSYFTIEKIVIPVLLYRN